MYLWVFSYEIYARLFFAYRIYPRSSVPGLCYRPVLRAVVRSQQPRSVPVVQQTKHGCVRSCMVDRYDHRGISLLPHCFYHNGTKSIQGTENHREVNPENTESETTESRKHQWPLHRAESREHYWPAQPTESREDTESSNKPLNPKNSELQATESKQHKVTNDLM